MPEEADAVESAGDADRMMRMIVGSVYLDPQDIRRKLERSGDKAAQGSELHFGLVMVAVALVFLNFALDLSVLKWQ